MAGFAQPAGSHQQVMSPTLGQGYGTTAVASSVSAAGAGTDGSQTTSIGNGAPMELHAGPEVSDVDGGSAVVPEVATGRARGHADEMVEITRVSKELCGAQEPLERIRESPGGSPRLKVESGVLQTTCVEAVRRNIGPGHRGDALPDSKGSGTLEVESRGFWSAQGLPSTSLAGSFSAPSQLVSKVGRLMQDVSRRCHEAWNMAEP